jgi:plasmid stability protein
VEEPAGEINGQHTYCSNSGDTYAVPLSPRRRICLRGGRRSIDMCSTCNYVHSMAKMIQVRNVPDALHRSLKVRAAMAGTSLSDYLLGELREIAERPTLAEFRERLHKRKPLPIALDTGGLLREERTAR